MIVIDPPIDAAAILELSAETASDVIGTSCVSMETRNVPSGVKSRTTPSAPAATISPLVETVRAFTGEPSVTTVAAADSGSSGQILTVLSYPAETNLPSGRKPTAFTLP